MSVVGFQFFFNGTPKPYISPARAKSTAQDASDCVAAMAQIEDGLFYLSSEADIATAAAAADIGACADICLADDLCVLATYDYAALGDKCKTLIISEETDE